MSTGNGHSHRYGKIDEFGITVDPVIRAAGILA